MFSWYPECSGGGETPCRLERLCRPNHRLITAVAEPKHEVAASPCTIAPNRRFPNWRPVPNAKGEQSTACRFEICSESPASSLEVQHEKTSNHQCRGPTDVVG